MTMAATATRPERAAPSGAASSGLDTMLTDATRGPLRRMLPGRAAAKLAGRLALRPDAIVTRGAQLAGELAKIGMGRSDVEPPKRDRRFKDPAWAGNPAFKRLLQTYLATGRTLDCLIGDAGLDWRSERQVRFALENVLDALAPSNAPLTNPAVLKVALDTGGRNLLQGAANFARDMSRPPRIPSMVDRRSRSAATSR
jgi:polyhydroxyalkanoate synthase